MQGSTLLPVHCLLSGSWEPPSADAYSLAFDLACAARATVAPLLARARAGSSTTAHDHWLPEPVPHVHQFSTLRDEARLGIGTDKFAAPLRSDSPAPFAARALAGGPTTVPHPWSLRPGPDQLPSSLLRGAPRRSSSADAFSLPIQALSTRLLHPLPPNVHE